MPVLRFLQAHAGLHGHEIIHPCSGQEAESRAAALAANRGGETATLYFGGGTPSMLSDTHLGRLMETLDRLVPVDKLDEFSFEANPATFTEKKCASGAAWA